jgi:ankyrin repeat protein
MGDDTSCNNDEQESICRHPIHVAALDGNIAALEAIITNEAGTLELRDDRRCTPLHCAILSDHPECVHLLLKNGADPFRRGGALSGNGGAIDDNDAITMAAVLGHTRSMVTLLEFGLRVPVSALLKAAAMNRTETMSPLLASRKDFLDRNRTTGIQEALERAAMCWHVEAVRLFLPELSELPKKETEGICASLQKALLQALQDNLCDEFCRDKYTRQRQLGVIQELVAAGGDLSEYSIWSALNPLLHSGHREIARELGIFMIAHGVDIRAVDDKGRSPLAAVAQDGDDDGAFVSALLAAGAVISVDDGGNTPLHLVRQPSILKLLLDNGTNIASRNIDGWTPLISVTGLNKFYPKVQAQNRIEVCRILVSCGAGVNARARDGTTALHRAVSAKDAAVIKFLLEKGADTALVTKTGESALHCACKMAAGDSQSWAGSVSERLTAESLEPVRLLLEYGANVEARDMKGRTPLFYTLQRYLKKDEDQGTGEWATDVHLQNEAKGSIQQESYNVAVEACDLMIRHGADFHAQDKDGFVFRDLINRKWLLRPIADLRPERPVSPKAFAEGRGGGGNRSVRGSRGGRGGRIGSTGHER